MKDHIFELWRKTWLINLSQLKHLWNQSLKKISPEWDLTPWPLLYQCRAFYGYIMYSQCDHLPDSLIAQLVCNIPVDGKECKWIMSVVQGLSAGIHSSNPQKPISRSAKISPIKQAASSQSHLLLSPLGS